MAGILILLIVVLILRMNVARLRGPYCQFEDAINAGDTKTAIQAYAKMNGSTQRKDRQNAEKIAEKYAKIELAGYLTGDSSYETVSATLNELKTNVLKNSKEMDGYLEMMEYWREAEENYRLGNEAREAGLYEEAVVYYEKIPRDYADYDNAQFAIDECKALKEARAKQVIEDAMSMIDINEDIHTYLDAIHFLDDYIAEHPEDNFISARREQFIDEYYNIQLKNIETLLSMEEEKEALKLAKELKKLNPDRKEAQEYIKQLQE
ncbi:MAG: hypothetical protein K5879_08025 [Lachnospiraceae bacterium]|nr:hypothetical protein [Lachnospiraceae bacterium]